MNTYQIQLEATQRFTEARKKQVIEEAKSKGFDSVEVIKDGKVFTRFMIADETVAVPEVVEESPATGTTPQAYDITQDFNPNDISVLKHCITNNSPVLLVGQTGLGKTTLISELAKQHNKSLTRLSVHSGITGDEILGKWLAKNGSTVWQDGLLIQAMHKGEWIVFDEINAAPADVLFALHSLLDDDRKVTLMEKDGEVIKPHADFRFFATMNPIEDYAGTKELNMAFFSRFGAIVEILPFEHRVEVGILERKGIKNATAEKLVDLASNLRNYKKQEDIMFFCGTRDIISAGKLIDSGMDYTIAVNFAILNKMSPDDKEFIVSKDLTLKVKDAKDQQIERLESDKKNLQTEKTKLAKEMAQKEQEKTALVSDVNKLAQDVADLTNQLNNRPNVSGANVNIDPNTQKALKILGIMK